MRVTWNIRSSLLLVMAVSLAPPLGGAVYLATKNGMDLSITVVTAAATLLFAMILSHRLSKPFVDKLEILTEAARAASVGDFSATVMDQDGTQMGELGRALNQLITHLQSLRSISSVTLGSQDPDQLLQGLLESVVASTRAQGGAIALLDASTDEIVTRSSFRLPLDLTRLRHKTGEGLLGQVVLTGQPVIASDVQHDARVTNPVILELGVRSLAVLPLKGREGIIGVVYVIATEARQFSVADMRILEIMTDRAALAIENAHLLHESRSNEKFQTALLQVSAVVTSVLSLDRVLGMIAKEGERLLEVDLVNIWIAHESELVEMATSNRELNPQFPMRRALSDERSLTARVFQSAQTIRLNDIPGRLERPWIRSPIDVRSLMGVPMIGKTGPIGMMMFMDFHHAGRFTKELAQRAEILVRQASIAIENARLFGELEERRETLELLNTQLSQANKYKDEFLGIISHELRTPLNVITGSMDLLLGNFLGELTPAQRKTLEIAAKNATDLLGLINSILDLYRLQIGERPLLIEEFRMEDLCAEIEEFFRQAARQKGLDFSWHYDRMECRLRTDRIKLKELLHSLISNALKFTEHGRVEIRVIQELEHDRMRVEVEDTGIGMDKEVLPFVFDPFQQGDSSITRKYGGAGLGLTIAKRLLDLLAGQIEIQSEPGKGSLFRLHLPIHLNASSPRLSA